MAGVLYPMECAMFATKPLQFKTVACQTCELACSFRMQATTLSYSARVSMICQLADLYVLPDHRRSIRFRLPPARHGPEHGGTALLEAG